MADERPWRNAAAAAAVASRIAIWPVLGAMVGRWVEHRWSTGSGPSALLAVAGLTLGMLDAYRTSKGTAPDERPPR
jgi:hypothetical protein